MNNILLATELAFEANDVSSLSPAWFFVDASRDRFSPSSASVLFWLLKQQKHICRNMISVLFVTRESWMYRWDCLLICWSLIGLLMTWRRGWISNGVWNYPTAGRPPGWCRCWKALCLLCRTSKMRDVLWCLRCKVGCKLSGTHGSSLRLTVPPYAPPPTFIALDLTPLLDETTHRMIVHVVMRSIKDADWIITLLDVL